MRNYCSFALFYHVPKNQQFYAWYYKMFSKCCQIFTANSNNTCMYCRCIMSASVLQRKRCGIHHGVIHACGKSILQLHNWISSVFHSCISAQHTGYTTQQTPLTQWQNLSDIRTDFGGWCYHGFPLAYLCTWISAFSSLMLPDLVIWAC